MFVMAVMTMLCAAGVTFCLRFLLALRTECKPRRIGYLVVQRPGSSEDRIAEFRQRKKTATHAARGQVEYGPLSNRTQCKVD
jgi:hypothetical protein